MSQPGLAQQLMGSITPPDQHFFPAGQLDPPSCPEAFKKLLVHVESRLSLFFHDHCCQVLYWRKAQYNFSAQILKAKNFVARTTPDEKVAAASELCSGRGHPVDQHIYLIRHGDKMSKYPSCASMAALSDDRPAQIQEGSFCPSICALGSFRIFRCFYSYYFHF